jgi:hypothetical protein
MVATAVRILLRPSEPCQYEKIWKRTPTVLWITLQNYQGGQSEYFKAASHTSHTSHSKDPKTGITGSG